MRAIELFPCSGGMAEGFQRAGITFDMAFDHDPDACDSYERNLGHRPVRMDVRDVLRLVRGGWRPGPLDLVVADPPCTPWSRAGKRLGTEDDRDMLGITCELLALLQPRCFLIGNVPGLDDGPSLGVVQRLIGGLSAHGYCVVDYARLDAADYGVPQRRIRPFWFGHRGGGCLRWPEPTHGAPTDNHALPGLGLHPWVTCRQALAHLPPEEMGRPVRLRWKPTDDHRPSGPDEPAKTLTTNTHSDGALPTSKADDPAWTIVADGGRSGKRSSVVEPWPWESRPSTTVMAQIDTIAPAGEHAGQFGPNAIVLSERAAAILQGFPEGWLFAGKTKRTRWSQLGQAMPPALAEAVARSVAAWLAAAVGEKAA